MEKFNSEITKSTTLTVIESSLKANAKAINGIMTAIEQGIITSTTKERLLDLEAQKSDLENKLAVEQAKQIKPLKYEDVKNYIMYFAHKKYEKGEEKNEFFNSFINRVILFDDKVIIIYNTNKTETRELKISEQKQIISNLLEKDSENKKNSLETKKFKRVSTIRRKRDLLLSSLPQNSHTGLFSC